MALTLPITEVSLLAKEKFCFLSSRGLDYIIRKIRMHKKLSPDEVEKYERLTKEILNIVNRKATLKGGLSKKKPNDARLFYKNLIYIVTFREGQGKVVTVRLASPDEY